MPGSVSHNSAEKCVFWEVKNGFFGIKMCLQPSSLARRDG